MLSMNFLNHFTSVLFNVISYNVKSGSIIYPWLDRPIFPFCYGLIFLPQLILTEENHPQLNRPISHSPMLEIKFDFWCCDLSWPGALLVNPYSKPHALQQRPGILWPNFVDPANSWSCAYHISGSHTPQHHKTPWRSISHGFLPVSYWQLIKLNRFFTHENTARLLQAIEHLILFLLWQIHWGYSCLPVSASVLNLVICQLLGQELLLCHGCSNSKVRDTVGSFFPK